MRWDIHMEARTVPCEDLHAFRESLHIWATWLMELSSEENQTRIPVDLDTVALRSQTFETVPSG